LILLLSFAEFDNMKKHSTVLTFGLAVLFTLLLGVCCGGEASRDSSDVRGWPMTNIPPVDLTPSYYQGDWQAPKKGEKY
jgi:hypothetical protein